MGQAVRWNRRMSGPIRSSTASSTSGACTISSTQGNSRCGLKLWPRVILRPSARSKSSSRSRQSARPLGRKPIDGADIAVALVAGDLFGCQFPGHQCAVQPPSTNSSVPVTKDEVIAGEKQRRLRHLLRLADAAHGMALLPPGFHRLGIGIARQRPGRHGRVDDARHQGVDADALRGVVDGDRLGERGDGALGGDIGGVLARARLRELRADGHDGARLGHDHRLDGVVDPEIGALDVDREGAVPRRLLDRIDRAAGRHAGRRQQHVDAAPFLHDLGHAGTRLGIAADVGGQDDGAATARLDVSRDLAQPDLVLVDQGEPRTFGGEQAGRGRADARRRAGDDGYFVLELHGASLAREACAAPASRRSP